MIDGSIFVKTDALRLLREADVLTQNISNNLRQDTTITNQEFQKNITDVEAMQKQILTEKNILQKQLETLDNQAFSKEEKQLQQNWKATIERLKGVETTLEALVSSMYEQESTINAREMIEQWAQAFCNRDTKTILKFASNQVQAHFLERELLSQTFDNEEESVPWRHPGQPEKHQQQEPAALVGLGPLAQQGMADKGPRQREHPIKGVHAYECA